MLGREHQLRILANSKMPDLCLSQPVLHCCGGKRQPSSAANGVDDIDQVQTGDSGGCLRTGGDQT
jgi:hypothetical protein